MFLLFFAAGLLLVHAADVDLATIKSSNGDLVFGLPLNAKLVVEQMVNTTGTPTKMTDTLVNLGSGRLALHSSVDIDLPIASPTIQRDFIDFLCFF